MIDKTPGKSRVRPYLSPAPLALSTSVQYLKGAGPALAAKLKALGIERIENLLFHLPLRYEDRRHFTAIPELRDGEPALVLARVERADVRYPGRRSLQVSVADGNGLLRLRFFYFNDAQTRNFVPGRWVRAYGTVRLGKQGPEIIHPEYRLAETAAELRAEDTLTPCYPLTAGVTQLRLRQLIDRALLIAETSDEFRQPLPGLATPETLDALRIIHRPPSGNDANRLLAGNHPAQLRLIDEELLAHQLSMRLLRQRVRKQRSSSLSLSPALATEFERQLPFRLTAAQRRVLSEIATDLSQPRPMMRLVQGDVGSGKTVLAAAALLAAARSGRQGVLMAPTELLAEQHATNLQRWLSPLGIGVGLLMGSMRKAQREAARKAIANGDAQVTIGTHAVFQQDVKFRNLALVVVDEQHRFGVQQRLALREKSADGLTPHQLVMTATPIPRTLAQTVYADLDVSVVDELPPGRQPVTTVAISSARRPEIVSRIREACAGGRQVYWVCTVIEESDTLQAQAAEETAKQLHAELPNLKVGLVHGRLKSAEKESQMRAFKEGRTQLLVATTVIEVGVDVPNASIMVIDNAERLGLAQLHQLRGRVGRGARESQCVLLYQPPLSENAQQRLEVLRTTSDGFKIAQKDLELRGPGELLGRRQTGEAGLRLANPLRDAPRVPALQKLADRWLEQEPASVRRLLGRWVGDWQRYADV